MRASSSVTLPAAATAALLIVGCVYFCQAGRVFLSRSEERYAVAQVDATTNWTVSSRGSLGFRYRTSWKDGLLAFAYGNNGRFQLWLMDGRLQGSFVSLGVTLFSFNLGSRLNSDEIISVILSKTASTVTVLVFGATVPGPIVQIFNHSLVWEIDSPVYFGGLPADLVPQLPFSTQQFVGCLEQLKLSNTETLSDGVSNVFEERGINSSECSAWNVCNEDQNCLDSSSCRNTWTGFTCVCGVPADTYGPTCTENDSGIFHFQASQYSCTEVNLLTEPAFTSLETISFSMQDFFETEPKTILHLTSPANRGVSITVVGVHVQDLAETRVYLRLVLADGSSITSDHVLFFSDIVITRGVDAIVLESRFRGSQTITGSVFMRNVEFSKICLGGGSSAFPGPESGSINGLFVNGRHISGGDTIYETVTLQPTVANFGAPGSVLELTNQCTEENMAQLEFSFQTFDSDGELMTITEESGNDVVLGLTDGFLSLKVGAEEVFLFSENIKVNDGVSHRVVFGIQPNPDGDGSFDIVASSVVYFFGFGDKENVFCPTNSSILLGGNFEGCISDLTLPSFPGGPVNLTDFPVSGVTHLPCTDGCADSPCGAHGDCTPLSASHFGCNCTDGYSGAVCDVAPVMTTMTVEMSSTQPALDMSSSSSSPSSSPSPSPSSSSSPSPSPSSSQSPSTSSQAVTSTRLISSPTSSQSSSPSPTIQQPSPTPNEALSTADIIGITVGGLLIIGILALVVIIAFLVCMAVSNRRGYYKTREAYVNDSTLLRHNGSLRSVVSSKPLPSSPRKEAEYYI